MPCEVVNVGSGFGSNVRAARCVAAQCYFQRFPRTVDLSLIVDAKQAAHRACTFCVMDEALAPMQFDEEGRCECCRDALRRMPFEWWPNEQGQARLDALVKQLKLHGVGKKYDAMIGLSGGVDSAYLAHLAVRNFGLRVLAVHVDGGWNSAPAVHNIESIVRKLNLDLHTFVVEWEEMRDIQLAFLRSSVLNQDIPQDHAFFSTLYRTAMKYGVRDFLSGVNFSSESIVAPGMGHTYMDLRHLRAIHRRFGRLPATHFPFMSLQTFIWHSRIARTLHVHKPLNYMAYDKERAKQELTDVYGWRDYGRKHDESRFTKFYQECYLPRKFDFDKRRLHLSSLIVSGQVTRNEALAQLSQPISDPKQTARDMRFVAKKLGIDAQELSQLIGCEPVSHLAYPNQAGMHRKLMWLRNRVREAGKLLQSRIR